MPAAKTTHNQAEAGETTGNGYKQPSRVGKQLVAGHIETDTAFALREFLARLGRKLGERVTVQDAVRGGLGLFMQEYGGKPPAELKAAIKAPVGAKLSKLEP